MENQQVKLHKCPICGLDLGVSIGVVDGAMKEGRWYICRCGSLINGRFHIDKNVWSEIYRNNYKNIKGIKERQEYMMSRYIDIIEESTMGRRFLDVGFTMSYHMDNLRERGWISDGIDLLDNKYIHGDFEFYEFKMHKYDLIWMGGVLESFANPMKALQKAYDLLYPMGILFISTPISELMYEVGVRRFGNWDHEKANVFFSRKKLEEALNILGFSVIMIRENYSQRFLSWNNIHILCQKLRDNKMLKSPLLCDRGYIDKGLGGNINGEKNESGPFKQGTGSDKRT